MEKIKATKSLFEFEVDVNVRRSFSISQKAAELVEDYAGFHTEIMRSVDGAAGKKVIAGDVIEKLILKYLPMDKAYQKWRSGK